MSNGVKIYICLASDRPRGKTHTGLRYLWNRRFMHEHSNIQFAHKQRHSHFTSYHHCDCSQQVL